MQGKRILLYGLSDERKNLIGNALKKRGYEEVVFLDKSALNKRVGYLHLIAGFNDKDVKENPIDVNEEFMMINGFDTQEDLSVLFTTFRENGISRPVTSALTANNLNWYFDDLMTEVHKEHKMVMEQLNRK